MPNRPLSGAHYFLTGFRLIRQPGIRLFVIIPLIINILIFGTLIVYGWFQFQFVIDYARSWLLGWSTGVPGWIASVLDWIVNWLNWLLLPLFVGTVLMIAFFTFSWLANVIAGPFNGLLAEAVERHLTGQVPPGSNLPWYREVPRIVWDEAKKLIYYLFWALILFLVSFIPIINVISPFLWFLFGAWLLGLELADAPLGNYGYTARQQRKIISQRRYLTLEFGSIAMLITMIPIVNFIVMPVGVAGITCLWLNEIKPHLDPSKIK